MRPSLFALIILAGTGAFVGYAEAQNYPWCAYYSGGRSGGGTNCGFTSFEQCKTTVSGIGGFCALNTQYQPPPGPHRQHQARRKSHTQS